MVASLCAVEESCVPTTAMVGIDEESTYCSKLKSLLGKTHKAESCFQQMSERGSHQQKCLLHSSDYHRLPLDGIIHRSHASQETGDLSFACLANS